MGKVFLSHCLEFLAERMQEEISQDGASLLTPRVIFVPTQSMRLWLLCQCAKNSPSKGIAGYRIHTLPEGWRTLGIKASGFVEIFCALFTAVANSSDPEIAHYTEKSPKRSLELSYRLASLFLKYGQFGEVAHLFSSDDWQKRLLSKLFLEGDLRLPFQEQKQISFPYPIHCFGFDFLPKDLIEKVPSLSIYLFSPCAHFWEDVCTDRERGRLVRYWRKKGAGEEKREELDAYLREAPPLLRNLGTLGKEMLKILDPLGWETFEHYPLEEGQNTNLSQLQHRLLHFTAARMKASPDDSVTLTAAGASRFREIENLRLSILHFLEKEKILCSQIAVFAPNIQTYAPLIESIFSDLPYRIAGVTSFAKSHFYQGMLRLFDLVSEPWHLDDLDKLFENPSFCRAKGWDRDAQEKILLWLENQKRDSNLIDLLLQNILYLSPKAEEGAIGSYQEMAEWISILSLLKKELLSLQTPRSLRSWTQDLYALIEHNLSIDAESEEDMSFWQFFEKSMKEMSCISKEDELFPFALVRKILQRAQIQGQIHASHLHAIRFSSLEEGMIAPAKAVFLIGMEEESYPRHFQESSLDLLRGAECYVPSQSDRDRYLFLQTIFAARKSLHISYLSISPEDGKPLNPSFLIDQLQESLDQPIPKGFSSQNNPQFPEISTCSLISWPSLPDLTLPEGEKTISISELTSLAYHPWMFYLQKKWGIQIEDRSEETFAMGKAKNLREGLGRPLEDLLSKEPNLSVYAESLQIDLGDTALTWQKHLQSWGASLEPLSFLQTASCKKKTEAGWECPAISLSLTEKLHVKIVGDINTFSSSGFLHLGEDSIGGLLKNWPRCLAAAVFSQCKEVRFMKSGKTRILQNPEESLKAFLRYYFFALSAPSPLLPDWANAILRGDLQDLREKIREKTSSRGMNFPDPTYQWVLSRTSLPSAEEWKEHWSSSLAETFAELLMLYPARGQHAIV